MQDVVHSSIGYPMAVASSLQVAWWSALTSAATAATMSRVHFVFFGFRCRFSSVFSPALTCWWSSKSHFLTWTWPQKLNQWCFLFRYNLLQLEQGPPQNPAPLSWQQLVGVALIRKKSRLFLIPLRMCGCATNLFIFLQVKNKPWLPWVYSWVRHRRKQ